MKKCILMIIYRQEVVSVLKRKITDKLLQWKQQEDRLPLIIKGCRQCGKTRAVLDFAGNNYEHVVYLNFFENSSYGAIFKDNLEVDFLTMMMTAQVKDAVFEAGKTVIILTHEIEKCLGLADRFVVLFRGKKVFDGTPGMGLRHNLEAWNIRNPLVSYSKVEDLIWE